MGEAFKSGAGPLAGSKKPCENFMFQVVVDQRSIRNEVPGGAPLPPTFSSPIGFFDLFFVFFLLLRFDPNLDPT